MSIELPPFERAIPPEGFPEGWVVPSRGNVEEHRRIVGLGGVPTHDPVLHRPAIEVPHENITDRATRETVSAMLHFIDGEREAGRARLVGLAASQIGRGARIIAVYTSLEDLQAGVDPTFFINPRITRREGETLGSEGCFSIPGVAGMVATAAEVDVDAFDVRGNRIVETFRDPVSRFVRHETDHINGVLFPQRTGEQGRSLVLVPAEARPEFSGLVRQKPPDFSEWPVGLDYPFDEFNALKAGPEAGGWSMDQMRLREEIG